MSYSGFGIFCHDFCSTFGTFCHDFAVDITMKDEKRLTIDKLKKRFDEIKAQKTNGELTDADEFWAELESGKYDKAFSITEEDREWLYEPAKGKEI